MLIILFSNKQIPVRNRNCSISLSDFDSIEDVLFPSEQLEISFGESSDVSVES